MTSHFTWPLFCFVKVNKGEYCSTVGPVLQTRRFFDTIDL